MSEPISPIRLHKQLTAIWDAGPGLNRLAAVNHSVLGKRFIITSFVFFAIGGVLAMLIRTQLASTSSPFMDADQYAQVFTMHGTIMMFLFAIPLFEGFAIYLLPKMLGTRDMAFPRLTAYGYWCYLFGGSLLIGALIAGVAPNAGWFMYTPLSSRTHSPGINSDVWLLGVTFVEISALSAAIEIMVSILKLRAPGMSLDRMPIFGWYMLVVAAMMLIGFPPLILGSILLEVERAFNLPFFDPTRGGDPLLWQHLFWLFGHPEVYIIFLPAAGLISTMLPVFAGRPLLGYHAVVVAVVAMAFLSFGLWVHHMYTVGIPHLALGFFSAASALVAVPTAVQIFAWLATLSHGRPRLSIPMLYIFGFFFVFVIGGLTGVMLAMVPFDWQAHDTQFVVAHLHYVLVGGFVLPMLGAAYYYLPHVTGRQPLHHLSSAAFWLIFIGFNITFLLMHLTGLKGMPRRVHEYRPEFGWETLNFISSMGSFVMTMGFALVLLDLILLMRFAPRTKRNPWRATSLEWAMALPPPAYNFASLPAVDRRGDMLDPNAIAPELAAGRGYLGATRHGWMEVLGVNMISGRIEHIVVLPRPTFLPLVTALATGAFFSAMLFKLYWLALAALPVVAGIFLYWTRSTWLGVGPEPLPIGRDETAKVHVYSDNAPSWWAMAFTLAADATLFASLLFGGLFLWVSAPNWPPANAPDIGLLVPTLAIAAAIAASLTARRTVTAQHSERAKWAAICGVAHGLGAALFLWLAFTAIPDRTAHALSATSFAVLIYAAIHHAIGVLFAAYSVTCTRAVEIEKSRNLDLKIARQWHDYTAGAALIALAFVAVITRLGSAGAAS